MQGILLPARTSRVESLTSSLATLELAGQAAAAAEPGQGSPGTGLGAMQPLHLAAIGAADTPTAAGQQEQVGARLGQVLQTRVSGRS
jgi:hypothetical protein